MVESKNFQNRMDCTTIGTHHQSLHMVVVMNNFLKHIVVCILRLCESTQKNSKNSSKNSISTLNIQFPSYNLFQSLHLTRFYIISLYLFLIIPKIIEFIAIKITERDENHQKCPRRLQKKPQHFNFLFFLSNDHSNLACEKDTLS